MIQLLIASAAVYLAIRFIIFRKLLGEPSPKENLLTPIRRFGVHILLGIAVAAAMVTLTILPGILAGSIALQPGTPDAASAAMPDNLYLVLAQSALWEELAFRGVLMLILAAVPAFLVLLVAGKAVVRTAGFRLFLWLNAAAISSLVFSLAHSNNPSASGIGALNIFLVGMMLGLLFVRTGGLTAPYAFHFAWNSLLEVVNLPVSGYNFSSRWHPFSLSVQGTPLLTGGRFGPEASLPLTVLLLAADFALIWLMLRAEKARKSAIQEVTSRPGTLNPPPDAASSEQPKDTAN